MTWGYVFFSFVLLPVAFLAYLWFAFWCARRITRTSLPAFAKGVVIVLLVCVFVALPFGDEIVGRYKFSRLCEAEAAVRVHRVVALEKEHMDPGGWPIKQLLPSRTGYRIAGRYTMQFVEEEVVAWPRIMKLRTEVRDDARGVLLAEIVEFGYWGGWLVHQLPGQLVGESCPALREKRVPLEKAVFRPAAS